MNGPLWYGLFMNDMSPFPWFMLSPYLLISVDLYCLCDKLGILLNNIILPYCRCLVYSKKSSTFVKICAFDNI